MTVLAVGLVSPERAWSEISELAPTVAFLVAILVLGHLADAMGVFAWLTEVLGRRSAGSRQRLLTWCSWLPPRQRRFSVSTRPSFCSPRP
ncbi:hypothetical protein [Rhodococcus sp. NPDC058521]|uniref:hypothetical protein n=1 Tax=Rhodococcus sp. NPDC058521 TaxID=3346536 RepID=UPI00365C5F99